MKVSPIRMIYNTNKELIAVDFGHGARAQHNQGIEQFKRVLGVDPNLDGLDKYAMQVYPSKKLKFEKLDYNKEMYYVFFLDTTGIYINSSKRKHLQYWLADMFMFKYSDKCRFGINSAWNVSHCVIVAHEKFETDMKALYNAFVHNDILVGYSPEKYFDDGVLKFSIKSKVEALSKETALNIDEVGKIPYQYNQSLTLAEDLIYEKLYKSGESVDSKVIEKTLMNLSKVLEN